MKKILIVDDQVDIRELLLVTLSLEEYHILQAQNGKEAIEAARAHKPDLIIMDMMMPEMDGLDATRILKNDPETKDCAIVMLTSQSQKEDREKGYKAGVNDYFVKPFSPIQLIKKVEKLLEYIRYKN